MAEILGLGCTHWPTLCGHNETLTGVFKRVLEAPNVDPKVKDPRNWPKELLAELGNDDGLAHRRPNLPTAPTSTSNAAPITPIPVMPHSVEVVTATR